MPSDFYGFREQPFGVTPNPRNLFLSHTHREALASLFCGIRAGRGFLTLIAEPGMGKTTLLFQLMERLRGSARIAFLFHTQCNSLDLFRYLMDQLGLDSKGKDLIEMHAELNQVLLREMLAGNRFVLIIDEAQNFAPEVLETVRLISNFETSQTKLIQIVVAGQPELAEKLCQPGLEQLRQRIAIVSRLEPFSPEETVCYVEDRLRVAGHRGGPLFTPSAFSVIVKRSRGIPRTINMLCFNALSLGSALKRKLIDAEIVQEAATDLDIRRLSPKHQLSNKPIPSRRSRERFRLNPMRKIRPSKLLAQVVALVAAVFMAVSFTSTGKWGGGLSKMLPIHDTGTITSPTSLEQTTANPVPATLAVPSEVDPKREDRPGPAARGIQTVVVGPQDTILQISRRYLGRDDAEVVREIQKLNPQLSDLDVISQGQQIHLPVPAESRESQFRRADANTILGQDSQDNQR